MGKNITATPYYIMPLGVSIKEYLSTNISLKKTFDIILNVINTVEYLHNNDITHRDIKIENILMVGDNPKLSDFGLANFPKQKRISKTNEKIGPAFTIAPEMKRISSSAEYKKADVYSLAKTIWVILTKNWLSFDGQYSPLSSIGLTNYVDLQINKMTTIDAVEYYSLVLLEKLLQDATHNDPVRRPDIAEFKSRFEFWLESNNDYYLRNGIEWQDAIERIFPLSVPHSCVWTDIRFINNILSIIFSQYDQLNHSFFPVSGGEDFTAVEIITIRGIDYLLINKSYIIKPVKLIFELMDDFNWSYFRLEFDTIPPFFGTNVYDKEERIYVDEIYDLYENKDEEDYTSQLRDVIVCLEGSFLIVQKTAMINKLNGKFDHYTGLHDSMDNSKYKELLTKIKNFYQQHI